MSKSANDVVITGVGIVTCQGVGKEAHIALLTADQPPGDASRPRSFAPYPVHPLPEIDWSQQIAKRGDQRQMENWQRLGVFAAGLALDDAGFKDDLEACGTMDMIVAAGGGERDINVDTLIVDEALKRNDRERLLNEKLTTELRPTLFLAQLSNLLAGNISIVHKVTGSSRTFMGEEAAGISAVETAFYRIKAGESTHALVGGAFAAERQDMILLTEAIRRHARGEWQPLWSRKAEDGGGMITRFGRRLPGAGIARTRRSPRRPYLCGDRRGRGRPRQPRCRQSRSRGWSGFWSRRRSWRPRARRSSPASTGMHDLAARERAVLEAAVAGRCDPRPIGGAHRPCARDAVYAGPGARRPCARRRAKVPPFDAGREAPMTARRQRRPS